MLKRIQEVDSKYTGHFHSYSKGKSHVRLIRLFSILSGLLPIPIFGLIAQIPIAKIVIGMLAILLFTAINETIIKGIFRRPRPQLTMDIPNSHSFPSGHAATMMAAFLFLIANTQMTTPVHFINAIVVAIYTCAISLSRVYIGVHYITDILGGWVLGAFEFIIIFFLIR